MSVPANKISWEIGSKPNSLGVTIKELFSYRHLLFRLVRKDFLVHYQQTLLGPLWVVFQPLLILVTYVFVFNNIIGVSIGDKLPPVLFYFSGIILWNFFNESFSATSKTFRDNYHIFSKVYFPRLIVPLSVIATQFLRFLIQLGLMMILLLYFIVFKGFEVTFSIYTLTLPLVVLVVGLISLSLGLIFSVITAKYRDLGNFIDLFTRVLLFVTPIIYPISAVKQSIRWIVELNPLTHLFELFRFGLLGEGTISLNYLIYSLLFMLVSFVGAAYLFNRQGSRLIDII